jgi:2,4-dienoyl-CoA reductase-like NADH-dependent reductase (Old Yellow Enzyme family)
MSSELFTPLALRSGLVLRNRIGKAAMEERRAGRAQLPDERRVRLYQRWGGGGAGLLITGNVMVHKQALTGPRGVVLDRDTPLDPFERWAAAGQSGGAAMFMQISHPGRQVRANMPGVAWGPSAVAMDLGKHSKRFRAPTAMTAEQLDATVDRFVVASYAPRTPVSTASRSTERTVTCSRSSCPRWPTGARTSGAGRWRTAPGCCWRSSRQSVRPCRRRSRSPRS